MNPPPGGRPPTYEQMFYVTEPGFWPRFRRDLRLLKFLSMTLIFWATKGRRIRKVYRTALAEGRPFVIDREVPPLLK